MLHSGFASMQWLWTAHAGLNGCALFVSNLFPFVVPCATSMPCDSLQACSGNELLFQALTHGHRLAYGCVAAYNDHAADAGQPAGRWVQHCNTGDVLTACVKPLSPRKDTDL